MMTAMVKKIIVLVVIVLVVGVGGVSAPNESIESIYAKKKQDDLAGLKGVLVVVETLHPDTKETGLTTEQIQTDVELRLRIAGIKVLSTEDGPYEPIGKSFLVVSINAMKIEGHPIYAVSVKIDLHEMVFLARNPKIITYATTWDRHSGGYAGIDKLQEMVRGSVKDKVDSFINDYLAANPKEPVVEKKPTSNKKGEIISTEELMKEIQDNK